MSLNAKPKFGIISRRVSLGEYFNVFLKFNDLKVNAYSSIEKLKRFRGIYHIFPTRQTSRRHLRIYLSYFLRHYKGSSEKDRR